MTICRTCLTEDADKDMSQLTDEVNGETHSEIMMFCLSIEISPYSKITSKLCMKCYLKIISFYKFKVLALNNDKYLRSIQPNIGIKDEVISDLSDHDDARSEEMVYVEDVKVEVKHEDSTDKVPSDDDCLSVIKATKYEKDIKTEKENDSDSQEKYKKKKPNKASEAKDKICTEFGKNVCELSINEQHNTESVKKKYKCKDENCDKMFTCYSARKRHYNTIHLGIKTKCPDCDKEVVCLRSHQIIIHNKGPQKFKCDMCSKNFISKVSLDLHILKHTNERPHKCEICQNDFKSSIALLKHKRIVHFKEKSHSCQYCSKTFYRKHDLQIHNIRSHTQEKPHACPECGKCFATKDTLKDHMTVHSDVKSFKCDVCHKAFSRKGYLNAHMVSHTKEKRYPCKYCGTRFGRPNHRSRHERTAHEQHLPVSDIPKDTT